MADHSYSNAQFSAITFGYDVTNFTKLITDTAALTDTIAKDATMILSDNLTIAEWLRHKLISSANWHNLN